MTVKYPFGNHHGRDIEKRVYADLIGVHIPTIIITTAYNQIKTGVIYHD
jgi:hypothetical protein